MTPQIKSSLPSARNRETVSGPDNTGIWLSRNMIAYLPLKLVISDRSRMGPEWMDEGIEPNIICRAISPFSAVSTACPIRVSMRFIRVRVNASSSTTKMRPNGAVNEFPGDACCGEELCARVEADDGAEVARSREKDSGLGREIYVGRAVFPACLTVSDDVSSSRGGLSSGSVDICGGLSDGSARTNSTLPPDRKRHSGLFFRSKYRNETCLDS